MATGAVTNPASPSSSPRLPSPPPFTEVQFGPQSPSIENTTSTSLTELSTHNGSNAVDTRRIRAGTKAAVMASGPPLVPLGELDSPFQLQEHLKALYHTHSHPSNIDHAVPISRETASILATAPDSIDRALWLYELCRLLTQELNVIIVAFFTDSPPCSADKCPEMRASEWQYLCAVHDPPKPCCAIDYCCHTLDWASNMLTSPRHFPSRLTLGGDASGGSQQGLRNLTNIFRRLYRIFAHAWYQHRSVFWQVEGQMGLYIFFKTVCDNYQLIPDENYTVPRDAEGLDPSLSEPSSGPSDGNLAQKNDGAFRENDTTTKEATVDHSTTTTRRHRTQTSANSAVTTVLELEEDEAKECLNEEPEQLIIDKEQQIDKTLGQDENDPASHSIDSSSSTPVGDVSCSDDEMRSTADENVDGGMQKYNEDIHRAFAVENTRREPPRDEQKSESPIII
ncbi:MAG: hypothetical protein M1825_001413 [Sarcosagium campestre]|nr:MAG: hypothetical protein M1825_001413 [Sarcosagium campestre]